MPSRGTTPVWTGVRNARGQGKPLPARAGLLGLPPSQESHASRWRLATEAPNRCAVRPESPARLRTAEDPPKVPCISLAGNQLTKMARAKTFFGSDCRTADLFASYICVGPKCGHSPTGSRSRHHRCEDESTPTLHSRRRRPGRSHPERHLGPLSPAPRQTRPGQRSRARRRRPRPTPLPDVTRGHLGDELPRLMCSCT